jgi:MFS family permease
MSQYPAIKGKGLAFLAMLWFLWFTIMLVRTTIGPILPMVEDEFAINHARATTLASLFALGAAILTLASGIFAGRIGYKKTVLFSLSASIVMFFLIAHVGSFFQFALLLFIFGGIWGTYFPCVVPIVTGHYTPTVWGRALAIQDTGASLSVLVAPLLASLMSTFLSWRQFFYVFAAVYVVSGMLFLLTVKEVKVEKRLTSSFGFLKKRSVWALGLIWIFATGCFIGVYQIMPLYLTKELHLGSRYGNSILGLSRLGGVAFGVTMGFVVDRFDVKKSMFFVLAITGVFTMLLGSPHLTVVKVALFLQGTVIMGFFAIGLTAISRMFTMEERGMGVGMVATIGAVFGGGLIPYLFGIAGDHFSFRVGLFIFGSSVVLASGFVWLLKIPKRQIS